MWFSSTGSLVSDLRKLYNKCKNLKSSRTVLAVCPDTISPVGLSDTQNLGHNNVKKFEIYFQAFMTIFSYFYILKEKKHSVYICMEAGKQKHTKTS